MNKLKFKNDTNALERLFRADQAVSDYSSSHPGGFSEAERREFGDLLKERAAALSEATEMEIHSVADDD